MHEAQRAQRDRGGAVAAGLGATYGCADERHAGLAIRDGHVEGLPDGRPCWSVESQQLFLREVWPSVEVAREQHLVTAMYLKLAAANLSRLKVDGVSPRL